MIASEWPLKRPDLIARLHAAIAVSPDSFEQAWLSSLGPAIAGGPIDAIATQTATTRLKARMDLSTGIRSAI